MKKTTLIAFIILGISAASQAALIELVPSTSTVMLGDLFSLELQISGLGDGVAPSVGVSDINILYDSSVLQANGFTFGDSVLGNQLDLFGFGSIQTVTPLLGGLNLFELSLDDPSDLDDFQASAFTWATITFEAIAAGSSSVTPDVVALGDSVGFPIEFQSTGASVTVVRDAQQMPEPSAMALLAVGAVTAFSFRRRR